MGQSTVAIGQGAVYVVTGVWPLVSLRSFERVTGPKVDGWLVQTVGVIVASVGGVLLAAARHRRVTPEIALLGASCAASLATIDVIYVSRRRIAPVYLLDALVEATFVGGWVVTWKRRGRPSD